MTSDELKYAVLQYWRFKRQALYIATEVGAYSPIIHDVLMVCKNSIIEIECKVDAADFAADFRKRKHVFYAHSTYTTPNYLYYAIPATLKINENLLDEYPKYGLIRVNEKGNNQFDRFTIKFIRKAKSLWIDANTRNVAKAQEAIFKRMSSENVNLWRRLLNYQGLETRAEGRE